MNFAALNYETLRKYQRHHNVVVKTRYTTTEQKFPTKEELVRAIEKHFHSQQAYEPDAVAWFIYSVRKKGSLV